MRCEIERKGAVTVVKPTEPLTTASAESLVGTLRDVVRRSMGRVVIDITCLAYVDSAGLEALADVAEDLESSGRALKVCGSNDTLQEVLALTGLGDRFERYTDANEAVRSFL